MNSELKMQSIVTFLKESRAELKRVSWPSRKKATRLTGAVLTVTVVTALLIGVLDRLFGSMVSWIVGG